MQLKKLDIFDKDLFLKFQPKIGIHTQYMSFANLFLWKDSENIEYFSYNGFPVVTGLIDDKKRYFMVFEDFNLDNSFFEFLENEFEDADRVVSLTKKQIENFEKENFKNFEIFHDRNMDNYIYLSEKLATLSGKKLHSKRNHVNNFKKLYNYEFFELKDENINEVESFLENWYNEKMKDDDSLVYEKSALFNALKYRNELDLKGAFIKVDGKIVAFSMGEKMTEDMAVIHFEKADTEYKGAYAIINNEFVKNCWNDVIYINREDDMGIEGLRKAKLSYYPYMLAESYTIVLKEKKDE